MFVFLQTETFVSVLAIKIISSKLKNYYFVSTGSLLVFFESFHATSFGMLFF